MMNATTSNFPPGIAYMGGKYMPMEEAKISVLDWGFLRSAESGLKKLYRAVSAVLGTRTPMWR